MGAPDIAVALQFLHQQVHQLHGHILQSQQLGCGWRLASTHHVQHGAQERRAMLGQVAWRIGTACIACAQFVDDLLQLRDHLIPLFTQVLQNVVQVL